MQNAYLVCMKPGAWAPVHHMKPVTVATCLQSRTWEEEAGRSEVKVVLVIEGLQGQPGLQETSTGKKETKEAWSVTWCNAISEHSFRSQQNSQPVF